MSRSNLSALIPLTLVVATVMAVIWGCTIGLPPVNIGTNTFPTANAGADQNVELGSRVTLSGLTSTDNDGDPLSYSWQQTMGPTVGIDNPNSATIEFVPVEDGTYEFALTVTDDKGGSDTDTVRVYAGSARPEGAPFADAGVDQEVGPGQAVTLRGGNSADPDGGALSYSWEQLSGPDVSLSNVFVPEPSFTAPQVNVDVQLLFRLTVTDDGGLSGSDSVVVTVRAGILDDFCAENGLYGNGICNPDCPLPDPDCDVECVTDAGCREGQVCEDGECVDEPEPECVTDADCDGDLEVCEDGLCVTIECLTDDDCGDMEVCQYNECVPMECETDADCPEGQICEDGQCVEASAPNGAALYAANCAQCHGTDGTGPPSITGFSAAELSAGLESGVHQSISLSEEEIAAISQFLADEPVCVTDDDCDDGLFCNGAETCVGGACEAGSEPCAAGQSCNEDNDTCLPGSLLLDLGGVTMELVLIPVGSFLMGSENGGADETPMHSVTITEPFYIGKYEVTQEQFSTVSAQILPPGFETNPSYYVGEQLPVHNVTWTGVEYFLGGLSTLIGYEVRLPTEAEWEYACRAGSTTEYYFGDSAANLSEYEWYHDNSGSQPHEVGQKPPNAWGLYDMLGNVSECCADWYYDLYYASAPTTDPSGPASGTYRVVRGGDFSNSATYCRTAKRAYQNPDAATSGQGFRVVVNVP